MKVSLAFRSAALIFAAASLAGTTTHAQLPGWSSYAESGVTLRHPAGWRVQVNPGGEVLVSAQDESAMVLAHPFLAAAGASPAQWLREIGKRLPERFPHAELLRSQSTGSGRTALASLSYQHRGGAWRTTALCSISGRSGMLYAIASIADRFDRQRGELSRVLATVRYTGTDRQTATTPAGGDQTTYAVWRDPREGAFTLELPEGWKPEGGMQYHNRMDPRISVLVRSPDQPCVLQFGDASLTAYVSPNPVLAASGFTEGRTYSISPGVGYVVSRPVSGVEYGKYYVQNRIAPRFQTLAIISARDRPDIAAALQRQFTVSSGRMVQYMVSVGEVAYTCNRNGKPLRGECFMSTISGTRQGQSGWVPFPVGFVAPEEMVDVAAAAARHMVRSCRMDASWLERQSGQALATSRITTQAGHELAEMIDQSYWARQQTLTEISRKTANATLGLSDVTDPDTGETYKVASGHNYYWRRGDSIVGTNTATAPDVDFTPLREW